MKFNKAMRKECVTVNEDGTYTVKGGGWFWAKFRRSAHGVALLEMAPRMTDKPAHRLFVKEAKLTIEKHFPS